MSMSFIAETVRAPVLLGRRPVFDHNLDVLGYQLVAVAGGTNVPISPEMMARAGLDGEAGGLVGSRLAFVQPQPGIITGDLKLPMLPGRTVVEVPAAALHDPRVVDGCRSLVRDGYQLA